MNDFLHVTIFKQELEFFVGSSGCNLYVAGRNELIGNSLYYNLYAAKRSERYFTVLQPIFEWRLGLVIGLNSVVCFIYK